MNLIICKPVDSNAKCMHLGLCYKICDFLKRFIQKLKVFNGRVYNRYEVINSENIM